MSYNISICLCNIIYRQHSSTWELTEGRHDEDDHVTAESIELCVECRASASALRFWLYELYDVSPLSLVSSCLLKKYPLSGEQRWSPECNTGGVIILKIWRLKEHLLCGVRSSQYYYDRSHQEPPSSPARSLLHHTRPWLNQPLILAQRNLLCPHSNSKYLDKY